jgi:hypothetical protein
VNAIVTPALRYGLPAGARLVGLAGLWEIAADDPKALGKHWSRFPDAFRVQAAAAAAQAFRLGQFHAELDLAATVISDLRAELGCRPLPDVPALSLSAATTARAWQTESNPQAALIGGLSDTASVTVHDSNHLIQLQRPDAIVTAVERVLDAITSGRPLDPDLRGPDEATDSST